MWSQKLFNLLICSSIFLVLGVEIVHCSFGSHHGPKKLFVFGDSYADTGNNRNPEAESWKEPYGVTYPGKPSGRSSDGRIFTDFLAKYLGLKSPITYTLARTLKRLKGGGQLTYGMNFAYGGTGVFDTQAPYPNMTSQIDSFQKLLDQGVFTLQDLKHSVAHVSLAGNDYYKYFAKSGSLQGLQALIIPRVVDQLRLNLKRLYNTGVKTILVTGLPNIGCIPQSTFSTQNQQCDSTSNEAAQFHNLLLQRVISKLNAQTANSILPHFFNIDLYQAFSSIIQKSQRNPRFGNLLRPCCEGINSTYSCGDVDPNGNKMYTLCQNPKSYFFWDNAHPTQAGWRAVTNSLKPIILLVKYGF